MSALELARAELGQTRAWLVGGAVRDRLLGRETDDLDIVLDGEVGAAARALGRRARAPSFELSDRFGTWRVVAPAGERWQIDLNGLRGSEIGDDLRLRDFTVNALAEPLGGGELVDPLGGRGDLAARLLRATGPAAFAADPLRVLRLVRMACELDLEVEPATAALARAQSPALAAVAGERQFTELRRILTSVQAVHGIELMDELAALAVVLPELERLHGLEQNRFHHRDVWGHTLEVLQAAIDLEADSGAALGREHEPALRALLAEPLADGLTRGGALRFGALLHDAAKPDTRGELPDGRVIFPGHDVAGAELARGVLSRLRTSERLRAHVAALARNHLRLGFLVHERPLSRRALYEYLSTTSPVEVDVTLLSVADRLATRGDRSVESIANHLELAREVLPETLRWRAHGPPAPLLRGDELARALGCAPGPELGRVLAELSAAQFAGEVTTPEQALALARRELAAAQPL